MRSFQSRCLRLLLPLAVVGLPGCFSYQQPRDPVLKPRAEVRVRFASPRTTAITPKRRTESDRTCQATLVRGQVSATAGDTITLSPVRELLASPYVHGCQGGRSVRFERIAGDGMTVRAFSPGRTTALVLVVGGIAWMLASIGNNMTFDAPMGCLMECGF